MCPQSEEQTDNVGEEKRSGSEPDVGLDGVIEEAIVNSWSLVEVAPSTVAINSL